jgi:hypothetical protein
MALKADKSISPWILMTSEQLSVDQCKETTD